MKFVVNHAVDNILIHDQINCGEIASGIPPPFSSIQPSAPPTFPLPLTEYLELDHQLDQLDAALTVLEGKREQLHRDAKQLLADARAAREQNSEEEKSSNLDSDQTHGNAEK